jgi:hypothetical protein
VQAEHLLDVAARQVGDQDASLHALQSERRATLDEVHAQTAALREAVGSGVN